MKPIEEQELLTRVRNIDANTTESTALVRELKLWRKFAVWAFGLMSVATGVWELIKDLRGH